VSDVNSSSLELASVLFGYPLDSVFHLVRLGEFSLGLEAPVDATEDSVVDVVAAALGATFGRDGVSEPLKDHALHVNRIFSLGLKKLHELFFYSLAGGLILKQAESKIHGVGHREHISSLQQQEKISIGRQGEVLKPIGLIAQVFAITLGEVKVEVGSHVDGDIIIFGHSFSEAVIARFLDGHEVVEAVLNHEIYLSLEVQEVLDQLDVEFFHLFGPRFRRGFSSFLLITILLDLSYASIFNVRSEGRRKHFLAVKTAHLVHLSEEGE